MIYNKELLKSYWFSSVECDMKAEALTSEEQEAGEKVLGGGSGEGEGGSLDLGWIGVFVSSIFLDLGWIGVFVSSIFLDFGWVGVFFRVFSHPPRGH
jgi:hypothetical protein